MKNGYWDTIRSRISREKCPNVPENNILGHYRQAHMCPKVHETAVLGQKVIIADRKMCPKVYETVVLGQKVKITDRRVCPKA